MSFRTIIGERDPLAALPLPSVAASWPAVRRDAFAAIWAVVVRRAVELRCEGAPTPPSTARLGAFDACVDRAISAAAPQLTPAFDTPEASRLGAFLGAMTAGVTNLHTLRSVDAMLCSLPEIWEAMALLRGELVPFAAARGDLDVERDAWEALQESAAPPALLGDRWPVSLSLDAEGSFEPRADRLVVGFLPEHLPEAIAAERWITSLRERAREAAGRTRVAFLRRLQDGSALAGAAVAWTIAGTLARQGPAEEAARVEAARRALADAAEHADGAARALVNDARALPELVAVLHTLATQLRDACGMAGEPPASEAEALEREAGILATDERAARFLATLGAEGVRHAADVRALAKRRDAGPATAARWEGWQDIGARLAFVAWCDVVSPRFSGSRRTVALVDPVLVEVMLSHSEQAEYQRRANGSGALVLPGMEPWIGHALPVEPSRTARLLTRRKDDPATIIRMGIKLLDSPLGMKWLDHLVTTIHRQQIEGRVIEPRTIIVDGGFEQLAADLGARRSDAPTDLRRILAAEAALVFPFPDGTRAPLIYAEFRPQATGRPAQLAITAALALVPQYLYHLRESRGLPGVPHRDRLVPWPAYPPLVGNRPRDFGHQAIFSRKVVRLLRAGADEIPEHGGVLLSEADLNEAARESGRDVVRGMVTILDRWTRDADERRGDHPGPAFLERKGNRYHLGEAHALEREFLNDAGRRVEDARARGQRSAAGRTRARAKRAARKG